MSWKSILYGYESGIKKKITKSILSLTFLAFDILFIKVLRLEYNKSFNCKQNEHWIYPNRNAWFGKKGQCLKLEDMNLTFLVLGTPSGQSFYRRKYRKNCQSLLCNLPQKGFPWSIPASLWCIARYFERPISCAATTETRKRVNNWIKKSYLQVLVLQFIICIIIESRSPSYRPEITAIKVWNLGEDSGLFSWKGHKLLIWNTSPILYCTLFANSELALAWAEHWIMFLLKKVQGIN